MHRAGTTLILLRRSFSNCVESFDCTNLCTAVLAAIACVNIDNNTQHNLSENTFSSSVCTWYQFHFKPTQK